MIPDWLQQTIVPVLLFSVDERLRSDCLSKNLTYLLTIAFKISIGNQIESALGIVLYSTLIDFSKWLSISDIGSDAMSDME